VEPATVELTLAPGCRRVRVLEGVEAGQDIRPVGCDLAAGQTVLQVTGESARTGDSPQGHSAEVLCVWVGGWGGRLRGRDGKGVAGVRPHWRFSSGLSTRLRCCECVSVGGGIVLPGG
jgi:hypothetical protein